jgi:hypothetical protein
MLTTRLFEPTGDQLVYHYCSADSFKAILESGRLRFSDINMLNDSTEHRWGYKVFEEAATRLINRTGASDQLPEMTVEFFNEVDRVLSQGQLLAHPFISSLSLDGNSLDQWCKYADDGHGYAIGFRADGFRQLPLSLLQVSYDFEEQVQEMMTALGSLHSRGPDLPLSGGAIEDAALISVLMSAFKHPSFQSEREVRCLRAISLEKVGSNFRFVDPGGQQVRNGVESLGEKICYATRSGSLTAFIDIPYTPPSDACPIIEVVLGPKNGTNLGNVFLFLGSQGYDSISVRRSSIPYR